MKFIIALSAIIAAAVADVSHLVNNEYLPPVQNYQPSVPQYHPQAPVVSVAQLGPAISNEYLPPLSNAVGDVEPAHELHDDGYVYKNPVEERRRARRRYRLRYRHRRY